MSEDRPAREADPVQTGPVASDPVQTDPVQTVPVGKAQDEQDEQETPEPEGTEFVQVHRRRAPRFRAFVITGLLLAFVVSAIVAAVTPPAGGYSQQALFGYAFVVLAVVFCLVGALVAVLVDRRSGRRRDRTR